MRHALLRLLQPLATRTLLLLLLLLLVVVMVVSCLASF
jgi:hypothetical protein